MWNTPTGQELLTFKGHNAAIRSVAFSPDGKRLASSSGDKTVKVGDAETGQQLLTVDGHDGSFNSVAFSPNGYLLASGAADGTVTTYDGTPLPEKPSQVCEYPADSTTPRMMLARFRIIHANPRRSPTPWLRSVGNNAG